MDGTTRARGGSASGAAPPGGPPVPAAASAASTPSSAASSTSSSSSMLAQAGVLQHAGGSMSNYKILQTIGRGNFGVCHLCECIDASNPQYLGRQFVIKQINLAQLSASEKEGAVQEVKLLSELHHPFIVAYRESFLEGEVLCIVMQYCDGGDLTTLIKLQDGQFFPEEQILDWFIQLCLALRYIHQRRIIHRDLKSQNIFLTRKRNIRLGDFGIARVLNGTNELAMSVVGTPYSLAPEVCENKPYSFSSDVWAAGCVLYEMCTLKHAFDAHNLLGLVWKIVSESYPPIPAHYSQDLHDLVAAMLAKDPAARPSIDAILEKGFIRARLHSQIKAKMSLKTKKEGGTAAAAAGSASVTPRVATARPISSTTPSSGGGALPSQQPGSGRSHSVMIGGSSQPSPSPQPPLTSPNAASSSSSSTAAAQMASTTAGMAALSVNSATLRASPQPPPAISASRPMLDLGSPHGASPSPAAAATPSSSLHGPRSMSAQTRGPPTPASRDRDYGGGPLLSPTEQMQQRKKEQADQRAYELTAAVGGRAGSASGLTDRSYAPSRGHHSDYRGGGGGGGRPTTSQASYGGGASSMPSYQHAFDEDAAPPHGGPVPARQRSAGPMRGGGGGGDGSSSGRGSGHASNGGGGGGRVTSMPTPTHYGGPPFDWNASPAAVGANGGGGGVGISPYPGSPGASPVPPVPIVSLEDRPIKSSGSYRMGATPAMSPQAMQAARVAAQQGGGGVSPASASSSSSLSAGGSRHSRYGGDDGGGSYGDAPDSSELLSQRSGMRPSSVSSNNNSSRVTRVRDEDEFPADPRAQGSAGGRHAHNTGGRGQNVRGGGGGGGGGGMDDSYSDEDFAQYNSEDDDEILGAYTLSRSPSASDRDTTVAAAASLRPLSSSHMPSYAGPASSPTASYPSSSSSSSTSSAPSSSSSATIQPPPPMGSKCDAIRAKCLRSMSTSEFDEVCSFMRSRMRGADAAATPGLSKEELAKRFGSNNQELVFMVEQYVYLSELLQNNGSFNTASTGTAASGAPSGSSSSRVMLDPASAASASSAASADSGAKSSRANLRSASQRGSISSASANRTPVGTPTKLNKPSSASSSAVVSPSVSAKAGSATTAGAKPGTSSGRPGSVRK